jgi:translocation and assembly module TamA
LLPTPTSSSARRLRVAANLILAMPLLIAAPVHAALFDWWPFGKKAEEAQIPDPVEYAPKLEVDGDHDLAKPLRNAATLIERKGTPTSGLAGLIARARQDVGLLTAVLYQHGYYAGQIAITIDGKALDAIGPFDPIVTRPVPVDIRVTTGERFVFGRIETSKLPDGVSLARIGLVGGHPAESGRVVAAETAIADAWREQGHPLVVVKPRQVVADHAQRTLDVTLDIDAGPTANFGRVELTGTDRVERALVIGRANLHGRYTATAVKDATKRLRDLGTFDSVRIATADTLAPDGTIPVTITVTDRKPHVVGGTVFYSNTEGSGVEAYWRHRNLWGGAEQLEVRGAVSRLGLTSVRPDYRVGATLKKPGILDALTDGSLRSEAYRQTTDAYRVTAFENEVAVQRMFSSTLSGSLGFELARSRTEDATGTQDHLLATLRGRLEWDARDNKLDPLTGWRDALLVAPAHDVKYRASYLTIGNDVSVYRALGSEERVVVAGRIAAYSLGAHNVLDVPADRRLYAGGAGSVRGYGWKNIGPRNEAGDIIGGRSSVILNAETRYRINEQFGVAAFVDAGNAVDRIAPSFSELKTGVGLGLRYITPVGPLRVDVAVPLQRGPGDPRVAVYVGLGQAF